jgi:serine/threonine protein phosphatase PrpC
MRFVICDISVRGPRHIELGQENQDAMLLTRYRDGWLAAVADGVGSCRYSSVGSRKACQSVKKVFQNTNNSSSDFKVMLKILHEQWLTLISPYQVNDVTTTLLLTSVGSNGEVKAAQLGDGLILVRSGGFFYCVTPEREGYGNQTSALERTHKPEKWLEHFCSLKQFGDGIVLMTDGIADDLDPTQLPEFMETLFQVFIKRNRRTSRKWLQKQLENWTTPMHSDDKSLVAIFRTSK